LHTHPDPQVTDIRCPALPAAPRFALIAPGDGRPEAVTPIRKPFAAETLPALARRIHRLRGPDALQLTAERIRWLGRTHDAVRVVAHDQTGDRWRLIGHAVSGVEARPVVFQRALQVALDATLPVQDAAA
jgi:hypothetical protein